MFMAYEVARELIQELREVVPVIEREDRELADQLRRAANSVLLNLGEGQRSFKGNKHKHYAIAHGSANEVRSAVDLGVAWGWLEEPHAARAILDRLLRLLWGLTQR